MVFLNMNQIPQLIKTKKKETTRLKLNVNNKKKAEKTKINVKKSITKSIKM